MSRESKSVGTEFAVVHWPQDDRVEHHRMSGKSEQMVATTFALARDPLRRASPVPERTASVRRINRSLRFALVTAALLAAIAGCGSVADREDAARRAALNFHRAIDTGDYDQACDLLTPATREALAQDESCPSALHDVALPPGARVGAVGVWGQAAQVVLGSDTVFLTVFDGKWVVRAAGCRADPPGPYDCSIEAG